MSKEPSANGLSTIPHGQGSSPNGRPWYQSAYRRNLVDMHINDWNETFLSQFDAQRYVELLKRADVQAAMVYAHSHVGLCNYPTRVGQMHRSLKGRNILGEVIEACHRADLPVVVYISGVFDRWAADNHQDWRVIGTNGIRYEDQWPDSPSRMGTCCMNSPYRDYIAALAEEISTQFEFEGMFIDMDYWPSICYCRHCQQRYRDEVGADLPRIINWEDPTWVRFQRKREEWQADFAALLTGTVKRVKPQASVTHQAGSVLGSGSLQFAAQSDFLEVDLYGDALEGSFIRKFFYNLSNHRPFCVMASMCANAFQHTALKSQELLTVKYSASLADSGAFLFIDAIDPVGTLNPAVYDRMRDVFAAAKAYEPHLGGELVQDVAVYYSFESRCNFADNGKEYISPGTNLSGTLPHLENAMKICKVLIDHHIPYGVITKKNLEQLSRHKVLVLPNVQMMDEEEVEAIRRFVRAGGNVYASKFTSLFTKDGVRNADFMLAELFGVSFRGETERTYTYLAPTDIAVELFAPYTRSHPVGWDATQLIVEAHPDAEVLATLTLPYTGQKGATRDFASNWSDPPGIETPNPTVVRHRYGQGTVLYLTGDLERCEFYPEILHRFLKLLLPVATVEADAPKVVEVSTFHQPDRRRYRVSLLNYQKELPNVPVHDAAIRLRLGGKTPTSVVLLPDESELKWRETEPGCVEFRLPRLETLHMAAVEYLERTTENIQ